MHRFLIENKDLNTDTIFITDKKEIHHLKNVLRLNAEDKIAVFNGTGQEATGTIANIQKEKVEVKIDSFVSAQRSKSTRLILACAIPKKAKFETIIEKVTELGVDEVYPLKTKRTEVVLNDVRRTKKKDRYETVAINASKQSNRTTTPKIHPVIDFKDFIVNLNNSSIAFIPCLLGTREEIKAALERIKGKQTVIFLIGPEGDFTEEEIALAVKKGCIPLSLGDTRLKVDTAAISVIAFANFYLS